MKVGILGCLFNDWPSAHQLAGDIDAELRKNGLSADIVFVNDGSTDKKPADFCTVPYQAVKSVKIVNAKTNLGHQRAIALGLWYVREHSDYDCIVVMDSDGEDKPSDVVRLVRRWTERGGDYLIFAGRAKRSEGWLFRMFYGLYKLLHVSLTGRKINFGNFSVLARLHVELLLVEPDLWNHYAAAVVKTRIPYETLPTSRGKRYQGVSKVRFTSLVIHGLSALSCFKEIIAVRLIIASLVAMALLAVAGAAVLWIKMFTDYAVEGWATTAFGIVVMVFTQLLVILALFVIGLLGGRNQYSFMPVRDCAYYFGGDEITARAA
jgi:hypothetical protein